MVFIMKVPSHNSVGNDTKPRYAGLFLWRTHLVQGLNQQNNKRKPYVAVQQ